MCLLVSCLLVACDRGDSNKDAERELSIKEGDARATGSACRQAGRALEDCYNLNPTAQRASVFCRLARYERLYAREQNGRS